MSDKKFRLAEGWALDARPFFSQRLFLLAIVVLCCALIGGPAWLMWGRSIDLSPAGFGYFLDQMKPLVPIGVLCVAFIALIARAHSSVQTADQIAKSQRQIDNAIKQIHLTETQNAFLNYYKHFEEFKQVVLSHTPREYEFNAHGLYHYIFPNNGPTAISLSPDEQKIAELLGKAQRVTDGLRVGNPCNLTTISELGAYLDGCFVIHDFVKIMEVNALVLGDDAPVDSKTSATFAGLCSALETIVNTAIPASKRAH